MEKSVFSHSNYREFLKQASSTHASGRGIKRRLAEAMEIQAAYFSLVLKEERHLSVEQLILAGHFLRLSKEENEYLVNLLEYERAANRSVKAFLLQLLNEKRQRSNKVKNRVRIESELGDHDKAVYYSDVAYGAIHMAVTIPRYQKIGKIAELLKLPTARVAEIVEFLVEKGLVEVREGELRPGKNQIFIDKSSPFVLSHHRNWRGKALESAALRRADDYHFSMGFSISESDAMEIRQKLSDFIEQTVATIKSSPEERLMGFCIDFFDF